MRFQLANIKYIIVGMNFIYIIDWLMVGELDLHRLSRRRAGDVCGLFSVQIK
jgi:hypothetical protein